MQRFPRTRAGVRECFAWAEECVAQWNEDEEPWDYCVVMEATGRYSTELAVWIAEEELPLRPSIINPKTAARYAQSLDDRNINDASAARALTCYGIAREPSPYEALSPQRAAIRDLMRYRLKLVNMQASLKTRAHETYLDPLIEKSQNRMRKHLAREVECVERKAKQHVEKMPEIQEDLKLLESVFGVGWVTATTVWAELGDLRRFLKARQLTSMTGITPRTKESGKFKAQRTRITKAGSPHVRRTLYMAVVAALKGDNDTSRMYHRLVQAGKHDRCAKVACMRKVLTVMRAVLISGEPYQKDYNQSHSGMAA